MDRFRTSLKSYLARPEVKQEDLASLVGKSQAALSRYATGARFPDRQTAALIDLHTHGAVSLSDWELDALARLGISAPAESTAA